MLQGLPSPAFPLRVECPPGACNCNREALLSQPDGDLRILRLTREEEKKLLARLEEIESYEQLQRIGARLYEQLGVTLHIAPSLNEVRTMRGFDIQLGEQPGLCRKTRQAIPAAIRRSLERRPEIAYAILDAQGLFGAQ